MRMSAPIADRCSGAEKCFTAEKLDCGYQLWRLDGKKDDTLTSE